MSRLIRTGLVAATRKDCPNRCCGRTHISYSLTLAGRATYAAAELGLSLNQLCYRTYARAVRCRSIINGEQEFSEKDVHPVFSWSIGNLPGVQSSGIVDGRTYAAWQQAVHQGVLHTCL